MGFQILKNVVNIGTSAVAAVKDAVNGNASGAIGNTINAIFGQPPVGQSDDQQQQYAGSMSTLLNDPYQQNGRYASPGNAEG